MLLLRTEVPQYAMVLSLCEGWLVDLVGITKREASFYLELFLTVIASIIAFWILLHVLRLVRFIVGTVLRGVFYVLWCRCCCSSRGSEGGTITPLKKSKKYKTRIKVVN